MACTSHSLSLIGFLLCVQIAGKINIIVILFQQQWWINITMSLCLPCTTIAGVVSLSPSGEVYVCLGKAQQFSCQVSYDGTSPNRLQWRVHFNDSLSQHDITQIYIPNDPVGDVHINRDIFAFILISSSAFGLNSTLTVDLNNTSLNYLVNGSRVSCSQGNGSDTQHAIVLLSKSNQLSNNFCGCFICAVGSLNCSDFGDISLWGTGFEMTKVLNSGNSSNDIMYYLYLLTHDIIIDFIQLG